MSGNPPPIEKRSSGRLVLPSLVISRFAMVCPGILTGLLLIEIGLTFGCPVGIMGQIRTASSIVGVISALVMGVLSVRIRHKSLLMAGMSFVVISALGCSFALNFNMMILLYPLTGLGMSMIMPMTMALSARHFPLERRTSAVGWLVAGGSSAYVIGAQVIVFIAGFGGWRLAYLGFVLPVLVIGLLLVKVGLLSAPHNPSTTMSKGSYFEGFRAVFSNMSSTACVAGSILRTAAFQVMLIYSTSFLRQQFQISISYASIIMTIAALCYTLGSIVCGRIVNRFGRKPLTVSAAFLASVFTISFTLSPNLWLALAMDFLSAWFFGFGVSAAQSLTLEQVPRFRGTMMSINSAAASTGSALGAGIGGLVLLLYGWEFIGLSLGTIGIAAAVIYYLFTIDPTRTQVS